MQLKVQYTISCNSVERTDMGGMVNFVLESLISSWSEVKQCLHANMKQITEISRTYQLNISEISNCSKCGRKISEKCHTVTTVGGGISKISEIPGKYQKYDTVATVGGGISEISRRRSPTMALRASRHQLYNLLCSQLMGAVEFIIISGHQLWGLDCFYAFL